jgi:hypothetical protein
VFDSVYVFLDRNVNKIRHHAKISCHGKFGSAMIAIAKCNCISTNRIIIKNTKLDKYLQMLKFMVINVFCLVRKILGHSKQTAE